jgi:hypothetical protein
MTTKFLYHDCAAMLRGLGYAPAAARDGSVPGAIRVAQIDWAVHARPGDEAALVPLLAPAHGPAPHVVADFASTWLASIVVRTSAADVLAAVEKRSMGAPVRERSGTRTYVFRASAVLPQIAARDGSVRVEQEPVLLGSPAEWRERTPLDVKRADLPELTEAQARELVAAVDDVARDNAPPFVPYTPAEHVPATERGIALERGNHDAIIEALTENGYAPVTVPWGDEPTRRSNAPTPPPAVAVYLRPPFSPSFIYGQGNDHRDAWLCSVSIVAPSALRADVERLVSNLPGRHVVRDNSDGSSTWLFQHDVGRADPFKAMTLLRSKHAGMISISGTHVRITVESMNNAVPVLGPDGSWRDGVSPLNVRRDELPVFDRNRAEALLADVERFMAEPYAAPSIVERVKRAVRG